MIHKQVELLNQICFILLNAPKKIDRLRFIYRFNKTEHWNETRLLTFINGKKEVLPDYFSDDEICNLCEQLHDVMQTHTGGDWQKFTLTIDEQGEAHTEFSYEPQSCLDGFEFAKDF